jgi:hypothetical protein
VDWVTACCGCKWGTLLGRCAASLQLPLPELPPLDDAGAAATAPLLPTAAAEATGTAAAAAPASALPPLSAGGASAPPLSPRRRSWGGTILEGAPDVGAEGLDEVEGAVAAGAGGAGFGGGPSAPGINAGSGAFSHKPWSPAAELLEGVVAGWAE